MTKKSTITNLLVLPLIGSAILLANPVIAKDANHPSYSVVRHKTNIESQKRAISGVVTAVNDNIVIVTATDNTKYTVDASNANIMKVSEELNANPLIVSIEEIKIGDAIVVRGEIDNSEIEHPSGHKFSKNKLKFKHS